MFCDMARRPAAFYTHYCAIREILLLLRRYDEPAMMLYGALLREALLQMKMAALADMEDIMSQERKSARTPEHDSYTRL